MKLPHWICHDWDKYDEPYTEEWECREKNIYKTRKWVETKKFQERKCKVCGIIQKKLIEVTKSDEFTI